MAQGAVAAMAPTGDALAGMSAEELRELLEYEKILQFRDAVLAGTHPRVKIPPHLTPKATRNLSSPISHPNSSPHPTPTHAAPQTQTTQNGDSSYGTSTNNQRSATSNQIDPIFLEKSDDLIKAEMNLQRVRLERALRDQIEDQRIKNKALIQTSESLPNFDISDVLLQAQALVNPSTSAQAEPVVAADSPADDSFDENTFYSSQHDSSEWSNSPHRQKEPVEKQAHDIVSVDKRPGEVSPPNHGVRDAEQVKSSLPTNNQAEARIQHPPALPSGSHPQFPGLRYPENTAPGGASMGTTQTKSNQQQPAIGNEQALDNSASRSAYTAVQNTTDQLLRQAFDHDRPSPLIRAHNLSPLAPQPARVSPLATAREPPLLRENLLADEAPPAQVAALRTDDLAGISSADSSPRGPKNPEKKKNRSKRDRKRKAKDSGDTPNSPYIKPEPKSPSPYAVAPLPRPPKRQRQQGQYAAELNYDDQPRYEAPNNTQIRAEGRVGEARESRPFEMVEDRYEPEFRRPENAYRPVERESEGYRRVTTDAFVPRPRSPEVYAAPYASDARPIRAASHSMVERRFEEPRYYKDPGPRTIVRPDADRERSRSPIMRDGRPTTMGPPRQPVRIVLDEHGREYYDPTPAYAPPPSSSLRQSVAPPSRYREGDIVYERAPIRTVSSRAAMEYEEDGVIYRRGSPFSAVPRRVVTQPEYAMAPPAEYRSYREREYSVRPTAMGPPMAPPGDEYVPVRAPELRQVSQYDEPPREYISRAPIEGAQPEYAPRAMSVRPEAIRYEVRGEAPREYARAPSVRPEQVRYEVRGEPVREYGRAPSVRPEPVRYETREEAYGSRAMSVRPEIRYEPAREPYVSRLSSVRPEGPPREYASSVRPEEGSIRREVMAPPKGDRYYEEVPRGRPAEIAFVERPRARESSVIVYADDVRREMYR